jgi:DNA-binding transcriptional regulator YhcF (GntR family)
LWVHLIIRANWKDKQELWNGKTITIKRGSFITSRAHLSEETGLSPSTVERALEYFESEQQIGQQNFSKYRVITLLNYDEYQLSGQVNGQVVIQPADSKRYTDKNIRSKEYKEPIISPIPSRFKYEPRHLELATYLEGKVKENLPYHKLGKGDYLSAWSSDFRKMESIDNVPYEKIKQVLTWSQCDDFWKKNILSGSKFREKFGKLEAKSRENEPKHIVTLEERGWGREDDNNEK